MMAAAKEVLRAFDIAVAPDELMAGLPRVLRVQIAVARAALTANWESPGAVLVLDEVTAGVDAAEREELYCLAHRVKAVGGGILFVSHDLDEVIGLCDRVSVLRDGKIVTTAGTRTTDRSKLIEFMFGENVAPSHRQSRPRRHGVVKQPAMIVSDLAMALPDRRGTVTWAVSEGEVLGLAGLSASECLAALFGAQIVVGGTLTVGDQVIPAAEIEPARAIGLGIHYLPANRLLNGAVGALPVWENMSLPFWARSSPRLFWQRQAKAEAYSTLQRLNVVPNDPKFEFGNLSGGNQQRALLGKWMSGRPKVLLLDNPTEGVDVRARVGIWELLHRSAADGVAVVTFNDDHEELANHCDRVLVFGHGTIKDELKGQRMTKGAVSRACLLHAS
jgi:ABC-type sugar transport system ATPase subunit